MTPENYLVDLINKKGDGFNVDSPQNIDFLKKVLLSLHHGHLKVNGQPPDSKYSLGNYFLDDNRIMFDFTHLNSRHKKKFKRWLLDAHEREREVVIQDDFKVSEYPGFPVEVKLNFWGRFLNSWVFKRQYSKFSLAPLLLSPNYQLNSIEIAPAKKNGFIVGLNQHAAKPIKGKYGSDESEQQNSHLNTKRLYLTNESVEQLCNSSIDDYNHDDIKRIIHAKHPLSITVTDAQQRNIDMRDYRQSNWFFQRRSIIFRWFDKFLIKLGLKIKKETTPPPKPKYFDFFNTDDLSLQLNVNGPEVIVCEKRPSPNTYVFCGGGAKIFGHLGCVKEFTKAGVVAENFAGSSAGAIMAMLCYLGYQPDDIQDYFQNFNSKLLVRRKFTRQGMSRHDALKSAIDGKVHQRFQKIKTALNDTEKGRVFLQQNYFNSDKPESFKRVTFKLLEDIRKQFPEISSEFKLGKRLVVTATNTLTNQTDYFSSKTTPNVEIAQAVMASSCFPVLYTPIIINGIPYRDGGLLNNFPIDIFKDDKTTFLQSEYGVDLKVIGFQFDNGGVERNVLDKLQKKIYRESHLYNKIIGWATGVDDSVSAWVKDRIKLLRNPSVVIIPVGDINATSFGISKEVQDQLIKKGQIAAIRYLIPRFKHEQPEQMENIDGNEQQEYERLRQYKFHQDEEGKAVNSEAIYKKFTSMEALLNYCYERNRRDVFDKLVEQIKKQSIFCRRELGTLLEKIEVIEQLFVKRNEDLSHEHCIHHHPPQPRNVAANVKLQELRNNSLFHHLHDLLCLTLKDERYFKDREAFKSFDSTRFHQNINNPYDTLASLRDCLNSHQQPIHIVLHLIKTLLNEYQQLNQQQDNVVANLEKNIVIINQLIARYAADTLLDKDSLIKEWTVSVDEAFNIISGMMMPSSDDEITSTTTSNSPNSTVKEQTIRVSEFSGHFHSSPSSASHADIAVNGIKFQLV